MLGTPPAPLPSSRAYPRTSGGKLRGKIKARMLIYSTMPYFHFIQWLWNQFRGSWPGLLKNKIAFWGWLFSLSTIPWTSNQAAAGINGLILTLLSGIPWVPWIYQIVNHSPVEGHLGCFQSGAIRKKAAIKICEHIFVSTQVFLSWE